MKTVFNVIAVFAILIAFIMGLIHEIVKIKRPEDEKAYKVTLWITVGSLLLSFVCEIIAAVIP